MIRLSLQSTVSLKGYINSQNTHICSTENPHTLHDVPLYAEKISVWCALLQMGIVGFLFFDSSVDSAVYRDLVQQFVAMFHNQMNVMVGFSKTVQPATLLNHEHTQALFGKCFISRNIWPPHYPQLDGKIDR
jgi:hypothetical protein